MLTLWRYHKIYLVSLAGLGTHEIILNKMITFPSSITHIGKFLNYFQGLENSWKRHKNVAQQFYEGLNKLGLETFVEDPVSS